MTTMDHPARHILLQEVTDNEGMLREEETSSAEAGEKEAEMSSVLWSREQILVAMKRTARVNGGKPLGQVPFEKSTGIRTRAWRGKFWKNYSELVREAG